MNTLKSISLISNECEFFPFEFIIHQILSHQINIELVENRAACMLTACYFMYGKLRHIPHHTISQMCLVYTCVCACVHVFCQLTDHFSSSWNIPPGVHIPSSTILQCVCVRVRAEMSVYQKRIYPLC